MVHSLLLLFFPLALLVSQTSADCACGYYDPATSFLWTDRVITYWNETASADSSLIKSPTVSPDWQGKGIAGDTGNGNESWVIASAPLNNWEDGFSSTFRTGYDANNVRLVNTSNTQALALDVSPANIQDHTTFGSLVISRRRDILYGSFRTMARPPNNNVQYGGSAFQMHVRFNQSETIDLGLYAADFKRNLSTLRWSYSASGYPAQPIITNLTELGNSSDYYEHRFDWTRIPGITFGNSAGAGNYSQSKLIDGGRDHHVPTTPSVFTYRHFATGEASESQGPPIGGTSTSYILYSRFFFNSSSIQRQTAFEQECATIMDPICSTDDLTLRGSTPFNLSISAVQYIPPPIPFTPSMWALICLSIWLGVSVFLFSHAMARRWYTRRRKYKEYYANLLLEEKKEEEKVSVQQDEYQAWTEISLDEILSDSPSKAKRIAKEQEFEMAFAQWNQKELMTLDEDEEDEGGWSDEEGESDNEDGKQGKERYSNYFGNGLQPGQSVMLLMPTILGNVGSSSSTSLQILHDRPLIKRWKRKLEVVNNPKRNSVMAEPNDGSELLVQVKPTFREIISRLGSWLSSKIFIDEASMGVTSTGQNKVAYLGSLRGFATLAVTLGHWITMYMNLPLYADLAWDPNTAVHYPRWMIYGWKMSLSLILGGAASFRVAMFFVLPARILGLRYLSRGGLLNLADSSIRRLPRIIFPVFLAALLEYFLIEVSTFRWISRLPSRTWNTWSYFENYGNLFEFFNSFVSLWFVSPPIQPAIVQRYAIGIMWTVPLMIQLTWSLFLCAIIARQIKSHWKRWSFYSACLFFNWYANRFDTLFIMGLTVADLDCNLNYRKRAKNGVPLFPSLLTKRYPSLQRIRLPGQVFAWIIFFTGFGMAWCEVSGKGPHLAPIKELALRPDFYTGNPRGWNNPHLSLAYNDLKFTCILPVLSFYLLCDLNETFAKAFSLKIWEIIGRHSFGVFLLHGAVFWSWGPFCLIQLLSAGLPYWAAHLIAFITSYSLLAVVAVIFTHTADTWGAWVSVALWRTVSRGYARRPGK